MEYADCKPIESRRVTAWRIRLPGETLIDIWHADATIEEVWHHYRNLHEVFTVQAIDVGSFSVKETRDMYSHDARQLDQDKRVVLQGPV